MQEVEKTMVKNTVIIMNQILQDTVLSIPFSGNFVAVARNKLFDEYVNAFPAIALIGKPASGKTTIAESVVIRSSLSENRKYIITGQYSARKLSEIVCERKGEYLILDDFANYKSSDTRRKMNEVLDGVVRSSYGVQNAALLILTAEQNVLSSVTESLKERMIMIDVTGWKEERGSKMLIEQLRESRESISELLLAFKSWVEEKEDLGIKSKRREFDERNRGMDDRNKDNYFVFYISLALFSEFLEQFWGEKIDLHAFQNICHQIYEQNKRKKLANEELVYELIKKVISSSDFSVTLPRNTGLCEKKLNGTGCDNFPYYCRNCNMKTENYYDPYELLLGSSSIWIPQPKDLYGYPEYLIDSGSLLIVDASELLNKLNGALGVFCRLNHVGHNSISQKQLSSYLKKMGLCTFFVKDNKEFCRFMDYPSYFEKRRSVYILIMNKELEGIVRDKAVNNAPSLYGEDSRSFRVITKLKRVFNKINIIYNPNLDFSLISDEMSRT